MEWIVGALFLLFIGLMLFVDLGVFQKKEHTPTFYEALGWTFLWVGLALIFNIAVYFIYEWDLFSYDVEVNGGDKAALKFFTGYLLEKSLSLDNIFVMAAIFSFYKIEMKHQHRILMYGIIGAIVLRFLMILSGVALMAKFSWIHYVFGALLFLTALKMLFLHEDGVHPNRSKLILLLRRFLPLTPDMSSGKFFVHEGGKWMMTPLFLALVQIEISDVLFAVDSIPAIFAITTDPFLVFTSNIFAILGLRSLYIVAAHLIVRFHYLKAALAVTLIFVAFKLVFHTSYPISTLWSLYIICSILLIGVIASIFSERYQKEAAVIPVPGSVEKAIKLTYRQAARLVVLVIGLTILLIGVAMIILPGPAFIFIPLGMLILATEFRWARKLLKRFWPK